MVNLVVALVVIAACIVIGVIGTRSSIAAGGDDRSNDNVMTAALRLAGAAFVFLAAFAGVSEWQIEGERESLARQQFIAAAELHRNAPQTAAGDSLRAALVEYAQRTSAEPLDLHSGDAALEAIVTLTPDLEDDSFLREEIVAFEDRHAERLMIPEHAVPWPIIGTVYILGLMTAILVAYYPTGSRPSLKVLQTVTSLAVIVAILGALTLLQSPSLESGRLAEIPTAFLSSLEVR